MTEVASPMRYTRATLDTHNQEQVEALRLGERVFREAARHRANHLGVSLGKGVWVHIHHEDERRTIVATFHDEDPTRA